MNTLFADSVLVAHSGGSGGNILHALEVLFVVGVVVAVLWWFGHWIIKLWQNPPLPAPTGKIFDFIILAVLVVAALNFLLGLIGYGFF
jgi:hypothetical protein